MPKAALYNQDGEPLGEATLSGSVFGAEVNQSLMHQAVVMLQANRRLGTASTLTRAEVRGGGRKPWRQKGLGRARHGTIRSPLWRGGGVVFGPSPRDFAYAIPKKARREALRSALSARAREGKIAVLEGLSLERPQTASIARLVNRIGAARALIVTGDSDAVVAKSARNLPGVGSLPAASLNVLDVMAHEWLVLTRDAVGKLEEALAP
ncbi:MAG: 50S ribosomal protein L4 [bacterium]|nr:50S ribosomal protein L4 [bacterium]